MASVTQPIREEHQELLPHIEAIREVAESVGRLPGDELRTRLDETSDFLSGHLIPHAQAEEHALYPAVASIIGAPQATATMSRDHVEVGRLTAELKTLASSVTGPTVDEEQATALRRVLFGLYALVKVHFAKEEEVYLPLLDARLAPEEARRMFAEMEAAAAKAKAAAGS
jgi:iron-sulfur cluster repair protein YtfE (RIC family)